MRFFSKPEKDALQERRLLPTGLTEFHEWSDRIISAALLPAHPDSQKYVLANLICELPVSCHAETDAYFVQRLRKSAANQVAIYYREKIYPEVKARLAEEEKQKQAMVTPPPGDGEHQVLEIKPV